jgi:hypothetical protein
LRQHLIDMNQVTLTAQASATPVPGGLAIGVTGEGRTREAIRRMIPSWAAAMDGKRGWHTATAALPNGARLTVTAADPAETRHIRGLGFIGLLASGTHHQPHHLAIARGEFAYAHVH